MMLHHKSSLAGSKTKLSNYQELQVAQKLTTQGKVAAAVKQGLDFRICHLFLIKSAAFGQELVVFETNPSMQFCVEMKM